jgi:hypothetical protein
MREWTVLFYFAGENRLYDEMVYQLKDLKRVNPDPDHLALLAEFSTRRIKQAHLTTDLTSTDLPPSTDLPASTVLPTPRRFHLFTDEHHPAGSVAMNLVTSFPETSLPETVAGDNRTPDAKKVTTYVDEIVDFLVWGIQKFPAEKYMVVFGGDGGGVLADFLPSTAKPPRSLKPRQLSTVFRRVREKCALPNGKIDIVGLDACLMSMTEICYGLREYANYLVSSQGNEDDLGWPYTDVFKVLNDQPNMAAQALASHVVNAYTTYYLDYALIAGASANLSAIDLGKMEALAVAVSKFVAVVKPLLPDKGVFEVLALHQQIFVGLLVQAHWVAQTYRDDQYTDIGDFFTILRAETTKIMGTSADLRSYLEPVATACNGILNVLGLGPDDWPSAIVNSCHVGAKYQYSTGLSVYFPWNEVETIYYQDTGLDPVDPGDPPRRPNEPVEAFALRTGWGDFIQNYVHRSMRPARPGIPDSQFTGGINSLRRDPPKGRGDLPLERPSAKNPPDKWEISPCVGEPLRNL